MGVHTENAYIEKIGGIVMKLFLSKLFLHSWKKYIILTVVGLLILLVNLLLHDFTYLINYISGLQIAGIVIILVGGLSILNYFGAYDFWAYAFMRKGKNGKKPSVYDYSEEKRLVRSRSKWPFGPYFIIGFLFLIISFFMYIWM